VEQEAEEEDEHLDNALGVGVAANGGLDEIAVDVELVVRLLGRGVLLGLLLAEALQVLAVLLVVGRHAVAVVVVAHLLERLRVALTVVLLVILQRVAAGVVLVPGVRGGAVAVRATVGVEVGHAEERAQRVDHLFVRGTDDDAHHGDERRPRVRLHLAIFVRQHCAERLERVRYRVDEPATNQERRKKGKIKISKRSWRHLNKK
jgi:hypothetical protein